MMSSHRVYQEKQKWLTVCKKVSSVSILVVFDVFLISLQQFLKTFWFYFIKFTMVVISYVYAFSVLSSSCRCLLSEIWISQPYIFMADTYLNYYYLDLKYYFIHNFKRTFWIYSEKTQRNKEYSSAFPPSFRKCENVPWKTDKTFLEGEYDGSAEQ